MQKSSDSLPLIVGKNICKLRKIHGLTQEELAEKIGIGQQALSRMERGEIAPRFERLNKFAEIFNCEIYELFVAEAPPAKPIINDLITLIEPLNEKEKKFILHHIQGLINFFRV